MRANASSGLTSNVHGGEYEPFASLILAVDTQSSSTSQPRIDLVVGLISDSSATADAEGSTTDRIEPQIAEEINFSLETNSLSDGRAHSGADVWRLATGVENADADANEEMSKPIFMV